MFQILSEDTYNTFSFEASPIVKIKPGQIAQLSVVNNKVVAEPSDGTVPLGLVVKKVKVRGKKSGRISHRVKVCLSRVLIETDNFDLSQRYPVNASLYLTKDNRYTTYRESPDRQVVGVVTRPPTADTSSLQMIVVL